MDDARIMQDPPIIPLGAFELDGRDFLIRSSEMREFLPDRSAWSVSIRGRQGVAHFYLAESELDDDREPVRWFFHPTAQTLRDNPKLDGFRVIITRDD